MAGTGNQPPGAETMPPMLEEWRRDVNAAIKDAAQLHQQASVTFERIKGQLDEHDRRISHLEQNPASLRTNLASYGGCLGQLVIGVTAAIGAFSGTAATVMSLIALLHH
jgi:hypothetical protein